MSVAINICLGEIDKKVDFRCFIAMNILKAYPMATYYHASLYEPNVWVQMRRMLLCQSSSTA
ncbi:hypothetical protein PMIT1323_01399 [Prochlorococcus marinus str. MIT 1323]|nr:hypothetical protein PMIT1323_01399 [Prochlorococcus marinus str. MIT 1323]